MLLAGIESIQQALQEGAQLDRIYMLQTLTGPAAEAVKNWSIQYRIPVNRVPMEKLQAFHVPDHHGVIALRSKIHYYDLQEVISFTIEKGETPLFLMLDGVTDIRNIGAIARTAWCCGVQAIIIPDKGVGALNEDAILTSAGALEKIAVCRVNSLMKAVDELHLNGILVYASEMKTAKRIDELDLSIPCALVLGSEDKGIQPALKKICDDAFFIPMKGEFESLNVSVATGMMLFETMRQRGF
jgi:23S rRNA (guanosine2251-2'-O)-methyltransferase